MKKWFILLCALMLAFMPVMACQDWAVAEGEAHEHTWKYEDVDPIYHNKTCSDCGETVEEFHDTYWYYDDVHHEKKCRNCSYSDWMGNHNQYCDKMGICGLCGATDVTFTNTFHDEHIESNETVHWWVCSKCSEIIRVAEHWQFDNNPGECYVCHAKMCAHTNKTLTDVISQVSIINGYDETYHWGGITREENYTCNDCNQIFMLTTTVEKEEHRLDEKGCCKVCSYEKPKPTAEPTAVPTEAPTAVPTAAPTAVPTAAPTEAPTTVPTAAPTAVPTAAPTEAPTAEPTAAPTAAPTAVPTEVPTAAPTAEPTAAPTEAPTAAPTAEPTAVPTEAPVTEAKEHYFSDRALQVVGIDWNDTTILPVDLSKDGVTQIPVRDNRFIVGYVLVEVKSNDVTVTAEMSKQVTKIENGGFCWIPDLEANLEEMTMLEFGTVQTKPGDIGLLYITGAVWHHQNYASISECSTVYWPNHPKWVAWREDHQKLIGE